MSSTKPFAQPFLLAFALSLGLSAAPVFADAPVATVEAAAAVGLLPAAAAATAVTPAQPLDDVEVEAAPAVDELTPAQRRAANRKAREELRRRFGPAIYVLN